MDSPEFSSSVANRCAGLSHLHSPENSSAARGCCRGALEEMEERMEEKERGSSCISPRVYSFAGSALSSRQTYRGASRRAASPGLAWPRLASPRLVSSCSHERPFIPRDTQRENVRFLLPHSTWDRVFPARREPCYPFLSSFSHCTRTVSQRYLLHVGTGDNPK